MNPNYNDLSTTVKQLTSKQLEAFVEEVRSRTMDHMSDIWSGDLDGVTPDDLDTEAPPTMEWILGMEKLGRCASACFPIFHMTNPESVAHGYIRLLGVIQEVSTFSDESGHNIAELISLTKEIKENVQ